MKVKFTNNETKFTAKVSNSSGQITTTNPLTVKNQLREYQINGLGDIPNVSTANGVVSGDTVVFNSNTGLYEVKHLTVNDISGPIDGGEF